MEIFKIGEEIEIAGYKSITLSDDMQTNINSFAEINGIDKSEAEKILASVPGLQNFIANLASQDTEEDYEITGDFVDDSIVAQALPSDVAKVSGLRTVQKDIDLDNTRNNKTSNNASTVTDIENQIAELKRQYEAVNSQLATAMQNEDEYTQYTLEQQEITINSQIKTLELNKIIAQRYQDKEKALSDITNKYPDNETIKNIASDILKLYNEFLPIGKQKAESMQNEDDFAQYTLDQQENNINEQLKNLEINLQKEIAKAEGKTLSDAEIESLKFDTVNSAELLITAFMLDTGFRTERIQEKRQYLNKKANDIASQKATAMQNEDEEKLYILEQQENSIIALDMIFAMDENNVQAETENNERFLNLVQKYPSNTDIQEIVVKYIVLKIKLVGIKSQKATAMQNEDEYAQSILEQQENSVYSLMKIFEIDLQQQIAKEEGRTLSDAEIELIQYNFDIDMRESRIAEKRQYLEYYLINIASQKAVAMQNNDQYAISVLEQQIAIINDQLSQINSLSTITDVAEWYDLSEKIIKKQSVNQTTQIQQTEEVTSTQEVTPTRAAAGATNSSQIIYADASTNNDNNLKDLLGVFDLPIGTHVDNIIKEGNKPVGFVLNGITYQVVFDEDGGVIEKRTLDANGYILSRNVFPPDPLEEFRLQLSIKEEEVRDKIVPYLKSTSNYFDESDFKRILDVIKLNVKRYMNGGMPKNELQNYIISDLAVATYNVEELRKLLTSADLGGVELKKMFNQVLEFADTGVELEKEAAKWNTEYVIVNGIKFRVKYLKSEGSNPCHISTTNDGKILISGNNCTVDVLGLGNLGENLLINGENLVINCNASTFDNITNNAKNSTINGSFADDVIENNGSGAIINAGDGDDQITNNATGVRINGDKGNDTIINYGNNTTVNGGDGDDVVNRADNVRTTIIPSSGNDRENIIHIDVPITPPTPEEPEDPEYPYKKEFVIEEAGVTIVVYSKTDDFSGVSFGSYKHLVRVTASDVKIRVKSRTYDDTRIRLEGDSLKFSTDVTLSSVSNYADNSSIQGTNFDDCLFNYADNVQVFGLDGKDKLVNEGHNVKLDGGEKEDHIYNRQADGSVIINNDGNDKVYNEEGGRSSVTISKGSMTDKEYNLAVTFAYLDNALYNKNNIISSTVSSSVLNNINTLIDNLLTIYLGGTDTSKKLTPTAEKLIKYEQDKTTNAGKTQFELLKLALEELDANIDGDITLNELTAFVSKIDQQNQSITTPTPTTPTGSFLGANLPNLSDATLESLSTSLSTTVGLTNAQMTAFINAQGSNDLALKVLKQIQTIINMCSSSSVSLLDNIKSMMTDDIFNFNNEILEDAQLVLDALNSGNYENYLKTHMILDASNLTDSQVLSQTHAGDVVKKADGKLYINDSGTLKKLNISEDTYISLFPPIGRYFIEQNDYEDCFFLATTLIDGMEKDESRAKIMQMFSENSSGDITVKFPNIDYPVTFTSGQLKVTDGIFSFEQSDGTKTLNWNEYNRESIPLTSQAKGLSMLEQAYALAKFAELSNANISYDIITKYYSEPLAAAIDDAQITDTSTLDMDKALLFYYKGGFDNNVYEDLYGSTTADYQSFGSDRATNEAILQAAYTNSLNPKGVMTTRILGTVPDDITIKYNLGGGHQYAIERIDTVNKIVYVKNPWESYMVSSVPYDVFFKYFSDIFCRTM